jgi:hypothetical protein
VLYHQQDRGAGTIAARKALAADLAISTNALWVRAHRLRAQLERCLRHCLDRTLTSGPPVRHAPD